MTDDERVMSGDWPLRPWIVAGVLGLCGLGVHFATDNAQFETGLGDQLRAAAAAACFFGGLALGFSLERLRALWAVGFAIVAALTLAGITYWVTGYSGRGFEWNWAFGAGLVALGLATPLFQTLRDEGRRALPYDRLHFHAWTDAVIGAAGLVFLGASWLLLLLVSELFHLIGFDLIRDLIGEGWFVLTFSGASYGAALALLRENERILSTLQRVVLVVFSVMAPFLAAALSVFLLLLLFTGLDTLWDATQATTPILLLCGVGAVLLANAVIRNNDDEASGSIVLRFSALVLALTILPLTGIAAISMGLRIDQYGLSPERIWGLLVVAIGCAYGLAALVSVIRGRMGWAGFMRPANTYLAVGVCGIALFLALPILDFGAISTRDQLARLRSGAVSVEEFDWRALKFDFGPAGAAAVKRLASSSNPTIAAKAKETMEAQHRYDLPEPASEYAGMQQAQLERERDRLAKNLTILPEDETVRQALLADNRTLTWCDYSCTAVRLPTGDYRMIFANAAGDFVRSEFVSNPSGPSAPPRYTDPPMGLASDSRIEVRPVEGYRVYVDGKPMPDVDWDR